MTDVDLLGAMISTGAGGKSFKEVARAVMRVIREAMERGEKVEAARLGGVVGMGEAKVATILAGIELGRRLYASRGQSRVIATSKAAYDLVHMLCKMRQEYLVSIYLNARYELIRKRTINIGTLNKIEVVPRDILIPALEYNAAAIILAHNHPSGDCTPSQEDFELTNRVKTACEIIGVQLLDHIVVGSNEYKSIEI